MPLCKEKVNSIFFYYGIFPLLPLSLTSYHTLFFPKIYHLRTNVQAVLYTYPNVSCPCSILTPVLIFLLFKLFRALPLSHKQKVHDALFLCSEFYDQKDYNSPYTIQLSYTPLDLPHCIC